MQVIRRQLPPFLAKSFGMVCAALFLPTVIGSAQPWAQANAEEVVHMMIDFSSPFWGDATPWLKQNGFKFRLSAEDLNPRFNGQGLVLETSGQTAGLFSKELYLSDVNRIRVSWGVDRYPRGADWEQGVYRVPIAVMVSFGEQKISSGGWFVPDAPYFIGIFLSKNAREGQAYTAKYYKKGGRYFCQPCNAPTGKIITTEFDLEDAFKSEFDKSRLPPVTGFGFQMNTEDTRGGARAFLKRVEFLSE